jgi:hypothetical protein
MNYDYCTGGCGVDFDEFPDMRHPEDECSGPECTCYEVTGGHQMGCYFYGKRNQPVASELVQDLEKNN